MQGYAKSAQGVERVDFPEMPCQSHKADDNEEFDASADWRSPKVAQHVVHQARGQDDNPFSFPSKRSSARDLTTTY